MAASETPQDSPAARTEDQLILLLRESDGALDTATISRRLRLHPNGVRRKLQQLVARGIVERERAQEGIGRPRDLWRLGARAIAETDRPHTGWAIARSLARAIPATPARLREVDDAGAELGREFAAQLGPIPESDSLDMLDHALEALGFEPRRSASGADGAQYKLTVCPYAEAVRVNPQVVCTLHRGIIRGVLDEIDPAYELTRFEPKDPDCAGCIVGLRRRGRGS